MARLSHPINIADLPEPRRLDPLPKGKYNVQVTGTDVRVSGTGNEYLWLELTVVKDPKNQGRKVFARIMLSCPNDKALDIGRRELRALCEACGLVRIENTDQLLNKVLVADVTIRPADDKYDASNDVRDYKPCGDAMPAAAAIANAPEEPAAGRIAPAPIATGRPW